MGKCVPQWYLDQQKAERQEETALFLSQKAVSFRLSPPTGYQYPAQYAFHPGDGYGFLLNIGHPSIEPYYQMFKRFLQRPSFPVDDWERKLFEADLIYNIFREECKKRYNESVVNYCARYILQHRDMAERWRKYREQHETGAKI